MKLLFVGKAGLGSTQMRGRDVAARMGAGFCDWAQLPSGQLDTVVAVKYWTPQIRELRRRCRRLIADPSDCWSQTKPTAKPLDFWRWVQVETEADAMLGCAPSTVEAMRAVGITAHLAPHHADERIGRNWYDSRGPVVYAGGERFLGDQGPVIKEACKRLDRKFVCRYDRDCWQALQGAALTLSVRFGKERTPLNVASKPCVKIANAARAGIPVLCTTDPAIHSLCDTLLVSCDAGQSVAQWESDINSALGAEPPVYPWNLDTHCELLRGLLG